MNRGFFRVWIIAAVCWAVYWPFVMAQHDFGQREELRQSIYEEKCSGDNFDLYPSWEACWDDVSETANRLRPAKGLFEFLADPIVQFIYFGTPILALIAGWLILAIVGWVIRGFQQHETPS